MLIVPGRCVKCPAKIVSGQNVGDLYNEIDLRTSDGSTVVIGICRNCTIEPEEIPELSRVFNESLKNSGFRGNIELIEILRRKDLPQVLKEVQSSICVNCDEELGPEFGLSNGRAIHLECPKFKIKNSETPADKKITVRQGKQIIRKGRAVSPLGGRSNVLAKEREGS